VTPLPPEGFGLARPAAPSGSPARGQPVVWGENAGTRAALGHLLTALLLVLLPPAVAGWLVSAWVVRCGWVSRGRLAAAGGVTGALALLSIDPAVAAGSLLGAMAALGAILPGLLPGSLMVVSGAERIGAFWGWSR
jgi:hypothetical protein